MACPHLHCMLSLPVHAACTHTGSQECWWPISPPSVWWPLGLRSELAPSHLQFRGNLYLLCSCLGPLRDPSGFWLLLTTTTTTTKTLYSTPPDSPGCGQTCLSNLAGTTFLHQDVPSLRPLGSLILPSVCSFSPPLALDIGATHGMWHKRNMSLGGVGVTDLVSNSECATLYLSDLKYVI